MLILWNRGQFPFHSESVHCFSHFRWWDWIESVSKSGNLPASMITINDEMCFCVCTPILESFFDFEWDWDLWRCCCCYCCCKWNNERRSNAVKNGAFKHRHKRTEYTYRVCVFVRICAVVTTVLRSCVLFFFIIFVSRIGFFSFFVDSVRWKRCCRARGVHTHSSVRNSLIRFDIRVGVPRQRARRCASFLF